MIFRKFSLSVICFACATSIMSLNAYGTAAKKTHKGDKKAMTTPTPTSTPSQNEDPKAVHLQMTTSMGTMVLELYPEKAPVTVKNFLDYVEAGHYNKSIFHRVINGFMIQGGGFNEKMKELPTKSPITNESKNGLKNERGTIAMARTSDPNSATAQFFINSVNNDFLNGNPNKDGYAVFGKVTEGLDVLDSISKVKTTNVSFYQDVPATPVVIESISLKK